MLSLQRNKQYFGGHNSVVLAKKKTLHVHQVFQPPNIPPIHRSLDRWKASEFKPFLKISVSKEIYSILHSYSNNAMKRKKHLKPKQSII